MSSSSLFKIHPPTLLYVCGIGVAAIFFYKLYYSSSDDSWKSFLEIVKESTSLKSSSETFLRDQRKAGEFSTDLSNPLDKTSSNHYTELLKYSETYIDQECNQSNHEDDVFYSNSNNPQINEQGNTKENNNNNIITAAAVHRISTEEVIKLNGDKTHKCRYDTISEFPCTSANEDSGLCIALCDKSSACNKTNILFRPRKSCNSTLLNSEAFSFESHFSLDELFSKYHISSTHFSCSSPIASSTSHSNHNSSVFSSTPVSPHSNLSPFFSSTSKGQSLFVHPPPKPMQQSPVQSKVSQIVAKYKLSHSPCYESVTLSNDNSDLSPKTCAFQTPQFNLKHSRKDLSSNSFRLTKNISKSLTENSTEESFDFGLFTSPFTDSTFQQMEIELNHLKTEISLINQALNHRSKSKESQFQSMEELQFCKAKIEPENNNNERISTLVESSDQETLSYSSLLDDISKPSKEFCEKVGPYLELDNAFPEIGMAIQKYLLELT